MKLAPLTVVVLLAAVIFSGGVDARTGDAAPPKIAPEAAVADPQLADLQRRQTQAQINKLEAEVKSLQKQTAGGQLFDAQISKLRAEVETLESQTSGSLFYTGLFGAVGGLVAALIAGVVTVTGYKINKNVREASTRRSLQEKRLGNDARLLGIFEHLGHEHARVQLASAAVLLELLDYSLLERMLNYEASPTGDNPMQDGDQNAVSIVNVLLGILKEKAPVKESGPVDSEQNSDSQQTAVSHEAADPLALRSIQKFIGDNIVKKLMAKPMNEEEQFPDAETRDLSLLHRLDWQGAQLENVWWKGVDARRLDLYEAQLHKAGLSFALLENVVFFRADLSEAVLKHAMLKGASLAQANVCGADLRSSSLVEACVERATYDERTKFLDDYDPDSHGMIRVVGEINSEV